MANGSDLKARDVRVSVRGWIKLDGYTISVCENDVSMEKTETE